MSHRHEINSILKQVELWPADDKRLLAEELVEQAAASVTGAPQPPSWLPAVRALPLPIPVALRP